MIVQRIRSWQECFTLQTRWNELAGGVPFRQWEWLGTWWQHYGANRQWFALAVFDDNQDLVGMAPWFIEQQPAFGRVVQFLGTGETCSEYLTILCGRDDTERVTRAIAEWLMSTCDENDDDSWDMLNLDAVSSDDHAVNRLMTHLGELGACVHSKPGADTWKIPLPATWDCYLRQLAKPHRRHARAVHDRFVATGQFQIQVAENTSDFDRIWPMFIDLHQRRRQSLGEPGCFASERFGNFLHAAAKGLFDVGKLELMLVEEAGSAVAVQVAFVDGGVTHAYQVGVNPDKLTCSPGWIVHTQSIKRAIEKGRTTFDFLRGSEPHKKRMGADPHAMINYRVIPPRLGPTMMHKAWVTGTTVKSWIKAGLEMTGMR